MLSRRSLLKVLAASQLVPLVGARAEVVPHIDLGPPEPFDFDRLIARAADLAKSSYVPPPMPDPKIVGKINYDDAKHTHYKPDYALYANSEGAYPVHFVAVGQLFPKSVAMHALSNGQARKVIYHPSYFSFPPGGPLGKLPPDPAPLAGFELRQAADKAALREHEGWASFAGASYFRGVGESNQYGLSARAVAQNSGVANPEEFPDFTHFWIEEGKANSDPVTVLALLDGPSLTGAYRFVMHRGRSTTMDITSVLTLRKPIERLGIAPLTSMYWYSETAKGNATDWRPEIHDSDGLAMQTGTGEHIWRPLINNERLQISAFEDENPRGFGLMQRDKNYDHYLDAVDYEKRPCCWVEPQGNWGKGTVQLVEIPTDNEIYDNVISMWVPDEPTEAGQTLKFAYKLLWRDHDPEPGDLALCTATRLGMGGIQGAPRSKVLRKFVVEFKGDIFNKLDEGQVPEAVLTASQGTFSHVVTEPSPDGETDIWRTQFDLDPQGAQFVEMRFFLRYDGKPLTETWLYRYIPFESLVR